MIWRKAWNESRFRFFLGLAILSMLCLTAILRAPHFPRPPFLAETWYTNSVWGGVYSNLGPVLFMATSILLGLGGLHRERALGTVLFTLALPVSRTQLIAVRAAVGLIEMAALAMVPVVLLPVLSPILVGQSYPVASPLAFSLIFIAWGSVAFSIGFLISTLVAGELNGIAVCLGFYTVYSVIRGTMFAKFASADPTYLMSGANIPFFHRTARLFQGPIPWDAIAILGLVAVLILASAAIFSLLQEF